MLSFFAITGAKFAAAKHMRGRKPHVLAHKIFGTTLFDGAMARKGYALNKMCFSFNGATNRAAFKADEEAYMRRYGLNEEQDHGLNFFLDKMPTFAVGAARDYRNDDEGWGIPTVPPLKEIPDLSWAIIDHLVERDFDIVACQELLVDQPSHCRSSSSGRRRAARGSGPHQHRAVPAAEHQALRRARKSGRRGGRGLERTRQGRHDRLGRAEPPARRPARRLH